MAGVNTGNSIYFLLNWKIAGICILCIKIFHGIVYPDISWYKSCFLVDFNGVNRWYIQNVGILDKHGIWCESLVLVILGRRGVSQNADALVVLVMILLSYLNGFSYIVQASLKLYELNYVMIGNGNAVPITVHNTVWGGWHGYNYYYWYVYVHGCPMWNADLGSLE